jgi:cbb3-type cytochrome oxidase subunit 3
MRESLFCNLEDLDMWLILIEALAALCLLIFLVWWIMFSGRRRGERAPPDDPA